MTNTPESPEASPRDKFFRIALPLGVALLALIALLVASGVFNRHDQKAVPVTPTEPATTATSTFTPTPTATVTSTAAPTTTATSTTTAPAPASTSTTVTTAAPSTSTEVKVTPDATITQVAPPSAAPSSAASSSVAPAVLKYDFFNTEPTDKNKFCTDVLGKPSDVFAKTANGISVPPNEDLWVSQWEKSQQEQSSYIACIAKSAAGTGAGVVLFYSADPAMHTKYDFTTGFDQQGLASYKETKGSYTVTFAWPKTNAFDSNKVKAYVAEELTKLQ